MFLWGAPGLCGANPILDSKPRSNLPPYSRSSAHNFDSGGRIRTACSGWLAYRCIDFSIQSSGFTPYLSSMAAKLTGSKMRSSPISWKLDYRFELTVELAMHDTLNC